MQTCQGVKLVIDHENFEYEDSIQYLGVVIHNNLSWNERIESLPDCELSESKNWLVKSYQTSTAFGCASRIIQ